jgi:hypothetical protein
MIFAVVTPPGSAELPAAAFPGIHASAATAVTAVAILRTG